MSSHPINADAERRAEAERLRGKPLEPQPDAPAKQGTPAPSFAAALQAARTANAATAQNLDSGPDADVQMAAPASPPSSAHAAPAHQASAANPRQAAAEQGAARAARSRASWARNHPPLQWREHAVPNSASIRQNSGVSVRLGGFARSCKVTAVIAADSPQALTELTRGAAISKQALQSAGLDLAENGSCASISRIKRQASSQAERPDRGLGAASSETEDIESTPIAARPLGMERWRGVRVDLVA